MPIYDYQCRSCGRTFEKLQSLKDADSEIECPKCQSKQVERLLSKFSSGGCGAPANSRFR